MSYRQLLKDVRQIVAEGLSQRSEDYNLGTTVTYWELGRRLVEEEQQGRARAAYGKQELVRLSSDLSQRFGRGFGVSSLRSMRQFYGMYKRANLRPELSWTHYTILMRLSNDRIRRQMEERCARQGWTAAELRYHLGQQGNGATQGWPRPKGELGLVQARRFAETDAGDGSVYLDLGFGIWHSESGLDLRAYTDRELLRLRRAQGGWQIESYAGDADGMWLYRADLERVVDGDTIVVHIDCGLGIASRQVLRLRGVNASPLNTKTGQAAREYIDSELAGADQIVLRSHKRDKYARYVADVFYGELDLEWIWQDGLYLNQRLVAAKLATRVQ